MAVLLGQLLGQPLAQCCVGAYDQDVVSSNGRYRVVAKSQNGTGPGSHGPYHFKFTTFRVADKPKDGKAAPPDVELGSFERRWNSRAHFNMEIVVSPTGNGFVLGGSMQKEVHFFGPDGRALREIKCGGGRGQYVDSYDHLRKKTAAQKHSVRLYGTGKTSRITELWIPLGQIVGPELEALPWGRGQNQKYGPIPSDAEPFWPPLAAPEKRWLMSMMTWSKARGRHERQKVQKGLEQLLAEPCHGPARQPLIELGLSAVPVLRERLAIETDPDRHGAIRAVLERIDQRLCGHKKPWQNRELLSAVAAHPDRDLRNCAVGRLRALAAKGK